MTCKMLFFDYRESEKQFFENHKCDYFDLKFFNHPLNEETVETLSEEDLAQTMIVSVFTTSHITEKVLDKFKNLRIISTRSTGVNHIDAKPCIDKNIALINVEGYACKSVAQFTFTIILMLVRHLLPAIESVRHGVCVLSSFTGQDPDSLVLGVVGTGSIGCAVCEIAASLGMKILAYDPSPKKVLVKKYNVQYVDFEELLKFSDVITLHVPYCQDNRHFISAKQFKMMKDGVYFVNASRGELVNLQDLLKFVKSGHIKGVGLDVVACLDSSCFEESKVNEKKALMCLEESNVVQELNKQPNVIITPHIAYDTQESVDFVLAQTFVGVKDFLYGGTKYRVF